MITIMKGKNHKYHFKEVILIQVSMERLVRNIEKYSQGNLSK